MSRIHEAITKAALERNGNGPVHVLSAEDILSTSFEAGTVLSTGATSWPSADSQLFGSAFLRRCPDVQWVPDKKSMLLYCEASDSPGREQIRSLRTKLNQLREQSGVKVIEITSALSGEGKSFIAANLAHALALHQERNVLLIDCDIRRGSLAGMLGTRTAPGLAEYLLGEEPLESVTQHGSGGSLYVIPSGRRILDPGELIGTSKLEDLLTRMRVVFDWIVIDTPPTIQFADAGVIAEICDGILLVFAAGTTPVHLAKRAAQELKKSSIIGAVLNRAEEADQTAKYFSYYGGYGA